MKQKSRETQCLVLSTHFSPSGIEADHCEGQRENWGRAPCWLMMAQLPSGLLIFAEARSEEPLFLSHFPSSNCELFYILSNITNGKHIISQEISNEACRQPYLSESPNFEGK